MAGLNLAPNAEPRRALYGGPFSDLARSQYRALAAMRWRMFRNTLRTPRGAIELGARAVAFFFYALMGLGIGAGIRRRRVCDRRHRQMADLPRSLLGRSSSCGRWCRFRSPPFRNTSTSADSCVSPWVSAPFICSISSSAWWTRPPSWAASAAPASGWESPSPAPACPPGQPSAWPCLPHSTFSWCAPSPPGSIAGWRSGARVKSSAPSSSSVF